MKKFCSASCLGLALFAASSISFAQDTTGTIVGTVTDSSGGGVAGAKVALYSVEHQRVEQTVKTASGGEYVLPLLPVGTYNLSIEAAGFKKSIREAIALNVNDKLTFNVKLEVGDVTQTVTVEEAPIQVQLQNGAEQSTTITGTQIRELALVTRNYEQLIGLMPGVSSASVDQLYVGNSLPSGQTNTIPFSVNGSRNSDTAFLVDGADNMDRGSNATLLTTPSIDSIAEFKVLRSGYSAESGRAGAGQVSVVTKSGTNEFHGDVFEFVRNNDFAANNFYNNATSLNLGANGKAQVPALRYNNFGETLGGPLYIPKVYNGKNKTFFFFSQEFRRYITYASGTAVLPTTSELNGVFPVPVCVQYSVNTCTQTSTTITNIDPVAKEYIKDIFSKLPLNSASTTVNSLFRNRFNFEQELYKIDHIFGEKLKVSARFLRDNIPTTEPQGLFTNSPVPGVAVTNTNSPGRSWVFRATASLTPTWLNEFGYNYSFGAIISDPTGLINSNTSTDVKTNLPFPVTLSQIPTVAITTGSSITGYGPYRDYNRNYNVYDNVTKVLGSHTIRFGASYNYYQKKENAAGANAGTFTFTNVTTPAGGNAFQQSFANFLLGNAASFSQTSLDITPDMRAQQWEAFAQDDWRIKPNLTINFGVRYSLFLQPTDKNGQLSSFDPSVFNPSNVPAITAAGLFATQNAQTYLNGIIIGGMGSPYGSKISNQDKKDFAPRFGFAWDPYKDGKTSLRGGYGIFYDPTLYGTFEQSIFQNPPFVNAVSIPNASFDNPAGGTASVSNTPKYIRGTPTNFPTPYLQQWSLGIDRQISKTMVVNVSYVGTKGTHLIGIVDLNTVQPGLAYSSGLVPTTTTFTSANETILNQLRPYKGYNAIGAIEPWFNSNYNSLQMTAQKRFSQNTTVNAAYTWSHTLTDAQTDRSSSPQNVYNFHDGEYGSGAYDRKQVFNLNFVYDIPLFRARKDLVGKALGGWEVSGIASYYSGLPYTVTTSGTDPDGLGIIGSSPSSLRPNLTCDPTVGAQRTRFAWFNTACFPNPAAGVHMVGDEGRGVVRGPGYEGWSFSGSKNVIFGKEDRFRFQLRGEASNAFNHTNPSTFGSLSNTSTLFGTITGYRDPRVVQLGAKFYF
jgi:Carboxypeptidase regulatory-like domain/TonB-dependent Receptor Plug Domain